MIRATRSIDLQTRLRRGAGLLVGFMLVLIGLGAAPAAAEKYVAMGDSYSAGTGSSTYDLDNDCQRSSKAYPSLIKADLGAASSFRFIACSGARIPHMTGSTQNANPVQSSVLGADTLDVTLSIGGNDAGFGDVLLKCGYPLVSCDGDIDSAQAYITNTMSGQLNTVYNKVRQMAPNARVGVLGYPRLFPANGDDCSAATFFSAGEIARLNQTADMLADVTRERARAHGFAFIDSRPAFLGHAWCEDEWINGLSNPTNKSYHPNDKGYVGFAGITRGAMLATPDPSFTRGANGRIAFSSNRDGNREIYVANGNGSFPLNLTEHSAEDIDPVFSPDGTRIAFASNRDGDFEIYTMASTGGSPVKLTDNNAEDREPSWSPNGKQIVFRSSRDGNNEIYRMNATQGSPQIRLTNNAASDFAPSFSPDGAEIAFQRYTAGSATGQGNEVFKMNADGQGQTNLTNNAPSINDGGPEWSPDGSLIAFHSNRDGDFEIFTVAATGGAATRRTTNTVDDRNPRWAPSGSHIVFESDRDGSSQIYTMTATGASQTRRTTGADSEVSPSWQGDARPPTTTIEAGPPAISNSPVATFGFSADELGSSFECRLGTGSFQPCSSPFSTAPLEDGAHTFAVRAKDPSGNVDPTPATRSFAIDTAGKVSEITAGPSGPTNVTEPVFEFSSEDASVTFECRLDPGPDPDEGWEECASPHGLAPLVDGSHRFEVRGTDGLGNVEPEPQARDFTVDTVAPQTAITFSPAPIGVDRNPVLEFEADEPGATFECRLDGSEPGAWTGCESPRSTGQLTDGEYVFAVRATDPAGNLEAEPVTASFRVDTRAPVTTVESSPSEAEPSPDVTFEFGADEAGVRFECRLDSLDEASWSACSSPRSYTGLNHGRHGFQVRAIDQAGNVESPPAAVEFGVKTDPGIAITSGPDSISGDPEPTITFEAADPDMQFECRFDSSDEAGWEPCSSPFQPEPLTDGEHRFELRGADWFELQKEKVDQRPVAADPYEWTVITEAPRARVIDGPAALANSRTAVFALDSGWGATSLDCRIDGQPWAPCDSSAPSGTRLQSVTFPRLHDGPHELRLRASGPLFGTGPEVHYSWTIDATAPEARIDRAPARHTASASVTWEFSGEGEPTGFRCRVDGSPPAGTTPVGGDGFGTCSSPLVLNGVTDGEHRFEIVAVDQAGNLSPVVTRIWAVDTRGPVTRLSEGLSGETRQRTARFGFDADEAPAVFSCRLDGEPWKTCASPVELGSLGFGNHRFEVRATDSLGNTGATEIATWRVISPTRPKITIKRKARIGKGAATLATAACPAGSACVLTAPRRVTLRVGARRFSLKVASPRRVGAGRKAAVKVKASKKARKSMARRAGKIKLKLRVKSGSGPVATVTRTVTVRS